MGHFSWLGYIFHADYAVIHVYHASLVAIILFLLALLANRKLRHTEAHLVPGRKLTLVTLFEIACESLLNLAEGVIGPNAKKYFPLLATLFIFIFFCNLLGIIPGFLPPTDNLSTTFACGIIVFIYFNYVGIKENGLVKYLRHFAGPMALLAPLLFLIEIIGIVVRPCSLALRLAGNMTGDHVVLGIFSDLVPIGIPVIFLALGIFVSFIQAFVFTLLSSVYVSLALPHEENHEH